ncbi:MAG: SDR family NAD(P)-dependent oxidoreductase, partial [Planctomycetota bacterium]|nr:SDR family NAD(P)-dependent oxidoreductase [Planctomycetota bacterium]
MMEPTIQQLFDLTGKVALITGGSGYLGQSLSNALAEAGASIVIASRVRERGRQVASKLPSPAGARHFGVQLDQLDDESLNTGFDEAVAAAGQVDILINNGQQGHALDLTNVTVEAFNQDLKNASGYFFLARRFRDHIVDRKAAGAVVMI